MDKSVAYISEIGKIHVYFMKQAILWIWQNIYTIFLDYIVSEILTYNSGVFHQFLTLTVHSKGQQDKKIKQVFISRYFG